MNAKLAVFCVILTGFYAANAAAFDEDIRRVSMTAAYDSYWAGAGVGIGAQYRTLLSTVYDPPRTNVKKLVFISAGQQFGSGNGNNLTGQPNNYKDLFRAYENGTTMTFSDHSMAGELIGSGYASSSDTFMAMAVDSRFNWEKRLHEKNDMVEAYYRWLRDQFNPDDLRSIFLAGHSRGGALVLHLAEKFNRDYPDIDLYVQTYDPVANGMQGELGTAIAAVEWQKVRLNHPGGGGHWARKMDMEKLFPNRDKLQVVNFVGGREFSASGITGVHALSHKSAIDWEFNNGWFRQSWVNQPHMRVDNMWEEGLKHFFHEPYVPNNNTLGVSYRLRTNADGWLGWEANGETAGTTGDHKQVDSLRISLDGRYASTGIEYRVHAAGGGWRNWRRNGQRAEYKNWLNILRRIEAVQIRFQNPPPSGYHIKYRAHVQSDGWQNWVHAGQTAGTTGQGKRLEALQVKIVRDTFRINGAHGSPRVVDVGENEPMYAYGSRGDSDRYFVSITESDRSWNADWSTEWSDWLEVNDRANHQLVAGTLDLNEHVFPNNRRYPFRDNEYYRIKLADGNGWDEQTMLVFRLNSDESESNNSYINADTIYDTNGTRYYGKTQSGQYDWWRFRSSGPGYVTLSLEGISAPYVTLTVYSTPTSSRMTVVRADSSERLWLSRGGYYFLRVSGYGGIAYSLSVND